jgi:UDP-glucose 4-epimerase
MNVTITGGCGFIGGHLWRYLRKQGHDVTCIDNFSTCNPIESPDVIKADLSDEDQVKDIEHVFARSDVVYHLAGSVGVEYIDKNPSSTLQNTLKINNNLFPLFEKYSNRVIYASSSEVYGNKIDAKESDDLIIGPPTVARWGYACSKLMAEFEVMSCSFPSTIARFFNVTGAGQLPDYGMVLPKFIQSATNNQDITVYDKGDQVRCLCDVRDAVQMLVRLNDNKHIGEIFNIGNSDNCVTINELAMIVKDRYNSTSKIVHKPYEDVYSIQSRDIKFRTINTDKMKTIYECVYSVDDIIDSFHEEGIDDT